VKLCNKCKQTKPFEAYHKDRTRSDGYHHFCKSCVKLADKKRYSNNTLLMRERSKYHYQTNKEKIKDQQRQRYIKNKDRYKTWSNNNKDLIRGYIKQWSKNNRNKINSYRKNRRQTDPKFTIVENLRNRLRSVVSIKGLGRHEAVQSWLGCDTDYFKNYIQSKFEPWMTWENKGKFNNKPKFGWDLDHIIPISSAKEREEIIKLFHYTNIQPLCSYINRCIKRDNF